MASRRIPAGHCLIVPTQVRVYAVRQMSVHMLIRVATNKKALDAALW